MQNKCLYIHLGAPKTGTTYIQKYFCDYQKEFANNGLLYPDATIRGYGHHDVALLLNGAYPDWSTRQPKTLDELAGKIGDEIASVNSDVLISSENFFLFPQPTKLKELMDRHAWLTQRKLKLIVYLRRQDDFMESWYNQMVKAQGFAGDMSDAIDTMRDQCDYEKQLRNWLNVFSADELVVKTYEDAKKHQSGILGDLVEEIRPELLSLISNNKDQRENISLSRDLLEVQKILNRLPVSIEEKRILHKDLMTLTRHNQEPNKYSVLSRQQADDLIQPHKEGNNWVAETFLGRKNLFPERPKQEHIPYPGLSKETAVQTMGMLIMALKKNEKSS
ncbi:hypothetical protein UF64_11545 [Thalassospira sp. HJ]|uniref:hypothetical protein n=1 Tax=Thalassospira sp. HJ TaxID=1616823 RepID=UPI0005CE54B0|nr:hypothetical protein [Thalassospira sp. HJ]KJE35265.1 hypothetical protein UF64_11545 [Thalassospira sp. HJ]